MRHLLNLLLDDILEYVYLFKCVRKSNNVNIYLTKVYIATLVSLLIRD
jgi:hypothetical protein